MITYDCDNLPTEGWASYRKALATAMAPVDGPCVVVTREGSYRLPDGWRGYLALDPGGYPYPVAADVAEVTYERAEP